MSTPLQDLLAVQELDLSLDQLRHRRAHLPQREQLAGLDDRRKKLQSERAEVDTARGELAQRQARAATEERSGQINARLYGGGVSASRDLQAMTAELEHLKSRASALEDSVLEILESSEPLDARSAELEQSLQQLAGEGQELVSQIGENERQIDSEIAAVSARRAEAVSAVPEGLLAAYERLRARLGGVGVARLVGNRCDGCHLSLSAVELDRVRHLPEGEIYTCEQCSRILVP